MEKLSRLFLILALILGPFSFLSAQTQLGADIDGEAAGDWSGFSTSISDDGKRVAVGAIFNADNGEDAGQVRIYEWTGEAWIQMGADIDGQAAFDELGRSVSLSADGSRVAIGAMFNDGSYFDAGHVRVYDWSGGSWTQVGEDIEGKGIVNWFGYSLSLSADGSRVAIGAIFNGDAGVEAGQVRIFELSSGSWIQLGTDIDGEAAMDRSGWSVSLSADGNRVAIGAIGNDGHGEDAGQVRVYEWSSGSWLRIGTDIEGEAPGDWCGHSVSLSSDGNRAAVGSMKNDDNAEGSGHVRIFQFIAGDWVQVGADIDGKGIDDGAGRSVSLSADGNRVAFGTLSGKVRLYDFIAGNWTQLGDDIEGEAAGDGFGLSVSLTPDGSRFAVGAPFNMDDAGHVRVFETISTGVKMIKEDAIEFFPNPTTGSIQVSGIDHGDIKIIDGIGRTVKTELLTDHSIDIGYLPDGIYYISILSAKEIIAKRIMKITK